eukprot:7016-Heterococcus_DN1.PRE.1
MLLSMMRAVLTVCVCSFLHISTAALGPQLVSLSVTLGQESNADPVYLRLHKGQSFAEAAASFCDEHGLEAEGDIVAQLIRELDFALTREVIKRSASIPVTVDGEVRTVTHAAEQDLKSETLASCSSFGIEAPESLEECSQALYNGLWAALEDQLAASQQPDVAEAASVTSAIADNGDMPAVAEQQQQQLEQEAEEQPMFVLPVMIDEAAPLQLAYYASKTIAEVSTNAMLTSTITPKSSIAHHSTLSY